MRDSVMEVLMYLFEHRLGNDESEHIQQEEVAGLLNEAGFDDAEIARAIRWLDGLITLCDAADGAAAEKIRGGRIYSPEEQKLLSVDCQAYLLKLEQLGIIDDYSREAIMDRLWALGMPVSLDEVRWVAHMVLNNLPGREQAFDAMVQIETASFH